MSKLTKTKHRRRIWKGDTVWYAPSVDQGEPKSDGDLSHLELGEGEVLPADVGYLFSPDCVHESMIQPESVQRTFLRIALPTEFEFKK